MVWKTLLVPHDFSACAIAAERLAAQLARTHDARVVLLHVTPLPPGIDPTTRIQPPGVTEPIAIERYVVEGALERLERRAGAMRSQGLRVATAAVIGELVPTLLAQVEANDADAIVMGTHGYTGLRHLVLGSVAEKVVQHASVPVVTVRGHPEEGLAETEEEAAVHDELAG